MFQSLTTLGERDSGVNSGHALLKWKVFPLNSEHHSFNKFWSMFCYCISTSKLLLPNSHFTDGSDR